MIVSPCELAVVAPARRPAQIGLASPRRPAARRPRRVSLPLFTLRYGVTRKPYSSTAGVNAPGWKSNRCSCLPASRSGKCGRSAKCARRALRTRPACGSNRRDPRPTSRRSCVSIDSGLVWSTTCDSSPRPKKYSIAAEMLLGLISCAASCPPRPSGSSAPAPCGAASESPCAVRRRPARRSSAGGDCPGGRCRPLRRRVGCRQPEQIA